MNQQEAIEQIAEFMPLDSNTRDVIKKCLQDHAWAVLKRYRFLHKNAGQAIQCSVEEEIMQGL